MKKFLNGLFFVLVAGMAAACYDCGPQAEPTLLLHLFQDTLQPVQRITALGAKSDSAFNRLGLRGFSNTVELPVSLLQDSTTFLFYTQAQTDTLTLFYRRIFDVKRECGYYVDLAEPETGPRFSTTLEGVSVEYNSYLGPINTFGGAGPLGIIVTLRQR